MVNSYGLAECLDKVERASGWHERIGKLPPGKGLGMACSHYVSGSAKPIHLHRRAARSGQRCGSISTAASPR